MPDPNLYRDEPGAMPLVVRNIGPLDTGEADHLIGYVPYGLSALCAENEEGKSLTLLAVGALELETKRPEDLVHTTRGEEESLVRFGTQELRVEVTTAGGKTKRRTSRSGAQSTRVQQLPDAIEALIHGGGYANEQSRLRTRLEALLQQRRVPVTPENLAQLAGQLPAPDNDVLELLKSVHANEPFPHVLAVVDYLADGRKGLLHERKRAAKRDHEAFEKSHSTQRGVLRTIRDEAARASGLEPSSPQLVALLRDTNLKDYPVMLEKASRSLDRLKVVAESRATILADRARAQAELGPEPNIIAEIKACEAAKRALDEAQQAEAQAYDQYLRAEAAYQAKLENLETARVPAAIRKLTLAMKALMDAAGDDFGELGPASATTAFERVAEMRGEIGNVEEQIRVLAAELELLAEKEAASEVEKGRVQEANAHWLNLSNQSAEAKAKVQTLTNAKMAAEDSQAQWIARKQRSQQAELPVLFREEDRILWLQVLKEQPEDASDEVLLAACSSSLESFRPKAKVAAFCERYQTAEKSYKSLAEEMAQAQARMLRLEREAREVWARLGTVMSAAINSEFVRVVGPDSGQEVDLDATLDEATEIKGLGVRVEVRLENGMWVDVADNAELSKGRLRRAFLEFFLERDFDGDLDQTFLIEDEVLIYVGLDGRRRISARAAAKRIRLLFEQPRTSPEDSPEIHLIWYGTGKEG